MEHVHRAGGRLRAMLGALVLASALACGLACGAPASAWAAGGTASGEMGVNVQLPAGEGAAHETLGDVGIRIELPAGEGATHEVAGDVGIRLELPTKADKQHEESGDIGIRLELPTEADERHEESGDLGIRLELPDGEGATHEASGDIGIRMAMSAEESTVSFEANGGAFADGSPTWKVDHVAQGAHVKAPDAPALEGYIFKGWYESGAATEYLFDENGMSVSPVMASITLYAKWEVAPVPVTVSFDLNHESASFADEALGEGSVYEWADQVYTGGTFASYYDADERPWALFPGAGDVRLDGCEFAGWWTGDGDGGEWGKHVASSDVLAKDNNALHARWIERTCDLNVVDPTGAVDAWAGAGQTFADAVTFGAPLPDMGVANTGLGVAVPHNPGYTLAGLWNSADADGLMYYGVTYSDAGGASWDIALAGNWTRIDDACDTDGDRVGDTVKLRARWDLRVSVTLPVVAPMAIHGDAFSTPSAVSADAFEIKSYTVEPVRVDRIQSEGSDVGLKSLFYTHGEGADRGLSYGEVGAGGIVLTVEPETSVATGDDGAGAGAAGDGGAAPASAVPLALTDDFGPVSSSADTAGEEASLYQLASWVPDADDPSADGQPGVLGLKFGLSFPQGSPLRAWEHASGDVAKVTFTISTSQQILW